MTLPQLAGRSRGCNAASPTTQNREFAEESMRTVNPTIGVLSG
jgi:hypothetical protein